MQADDLLRFQLAGDVQVSPAGDRIAFVVQRVNAEKNRYETSLYVARPGGAAVRFTGGENDSSPRFAPDGRSIAFLSKRSGQMQVWLLPVDGGEATQLTRIQGGVREFAWAPDGKSVAFLTACKPGEEPRQEVKEENEKDLYKKHTRGVRVITELYHKEDGVGYLDERRPQVFVVAATDGAEPKKLTEGPYHRTGLSFSPDGAWIFYAAREGEDYDTFGRTWDIYGVPAAGGPVARVSAGPHHYFDPVVTPDGRHIVAGGTHPDELGYDNGHAYLFPLDPAAWPVSGGRDLCPDYDRPLSADIVTDSQGTASNPWLFSPDGRYMYSLTSDHGTTFLLRIELATGAVTELFRGERCINSYAMDATRTRVAFAYTEPLDPSRVAWADLDGEEQLVMTPNDSLLGEFLLSEPQRFWCSAGPGEPRVDCWLMKPIGWQAGRSYPAVLEIHGGPMLQYCASFFVEFQILAARGYAVVYCNPRGSQAYGQDFCAAIRTNWGDRDYADITACIDQALADNPWIDPERLGVAGGSYGGFMTNWIVGHTQRFQAAVTMRSVVDWRQMMGVGDHGPHWVKRAGGVPYWRDDTWYRQQSPITYVDNIVTPLLIEHQEGDLRCHIDQGMALIYAVKTLGKAPVKFVRYPDEFHGMSRTGKPWHRIHRLNTICEWFEQYIPPAAPG